MNFSHNNFKISSGVIHNSIKLLTYFRKDIDTNELDRYNTLFNSNIKYCLYFLNVCEYIKYIENGKYIILKCPSGDNQEENIKELLRSYLIKFNPFWTKRIKWGLLSFIKDLSLNELHCFNEVSLLDFDNVENILWWNSLPFYDDNEINNRVIGIIGEQLSIKYEFERIRINPTQTSLLGGYHGYDILSKMDDKFNINKYIECKSTSLQNRIIINITNNEWQSALNNQDTYYFHIWKINNENKISTLYEISVGEMSNHIPNPSVSNFGKFTSAEIDLSFYISHISPVKQYENLSIFEYLLQE